VANRFTSEVKKDLCTHQDLFLDTKIRVLVCFTHGTEIHITPAAVRQPQFAREMLHTSTQSHSLHQAAFAIWLLFSHITDSGHDSCKGSVPKAADIFSRRTNISLLREESEKSKAIYDQTPPQQKALPRSGP